MEAPASMEMYCLRCRARREIVGPKPRLIQGAKGERLQLQGKCPVCGGIASRFIKMSQGPDPTTPSANPPTSRPGASETVQRDARRTPTLTIVDAAVWSGTCNRCEAERRFTGEYVGRRWDGKLVIIGKCLTCRSPQVVVGVREEEEEDMPVEQLV